MPKPALLALLLAAGAFTPGAAQGQRPVELAMRGGAQPHFVAAWAPEKEREAERSAALAGRVSLELANVSLDEALKALTNRAGLNITYSPAVLPAGKRVTIKAGDIAVITALTEMLFRSGLDVVVDKDGMLALVLCKHSAPRAEIQDSGTIVGTVTDKAMGGPLAGATVVVEDTRRSATTENDGRYRITGVEPGVYTVRARYIGYAVLSTTVTVGAGEEVTADFGLVKSTQKLDELVTVTPGGMQTQLKAVPSPITVITAEDIEAQRPQTFNDVFRQTVPSAVGFDRPDAPMSTFLSMRGATEVAGGGTTKILVDGIEVSQFRTSQVDPASIERVEVIRGPQAATVYGPDAAGGVIQIFTKRGGPSRTRPEVTLLADAGLQETPYSGFKGVVRTKVGIGVRGGTDEASYNLGASWSRLPNWVNEGGAASNQSVPSVYGGIRYARGIMSADISGRYLVTNSYANLNPLLLQTGLGSLSQPFFLRQEFTNRTIGARLGVSPAGWWQNQLSLGVDQLSVQVLQTQRRLTTPADTLFTVQDITESKLFVAYNSAFRWHPSAMLAATVTAGVDYYRQPAATAVTFAALNTEGTIRVAEGQTFDFARTIVTNTGYFSQLELGLQDKLFLTAGLRTDDNSTAGPDASTPLLPRVGVAYTRELSAATLKVRAAYGRALRAPSPGLTFGSVSPFTITLANPLLRPAQQGGWDGGVDILLGSKGSLGITVYDQAAKDLILAVQVATTPIQTIQYQNVGRVTNRGVEVEAATTLLQGRLRLRGNYAYTFSRIDDLGPNFSGDEQVGDRPRTLPAHTAGGAFTLNPSVSTAISAGVTYVGGVRQTDVIAQLSCFGGTGPCQPTSRGYIVNMPGFAKVNLAITQQLFPQLSAALSVDNLTNNLAHEATNVGPVQGRLTSLGLRLRY